MAKVVDIKAAYQRKVLASLDADFKDALSEAAECRLKIGLTLDEAAEVVPSALSPENAADHAELVRGLVLTWIRNQPAVSALLTDMSDEALRAFLFPPKASLWAKLWAKLAPGE